MKSISVFLDIAKFADFRQKMLMSAELKECVTCDRYFRDGGERGGGRVAVIVLKFHRLFGNFL